MSTSNRLHVGSLNCMESAVDSKFLFGRTDPEKIIILFKGGRYTVAQAEEMRRKALMEKLQKILINGTYDVFGLEEMTDGWKLPGDILKNYYAMVRKNMTLLVRKALVNRPPRDISKLDRAQIVIINRICIAHIHSPGGGDNHRFYKTLKKVVSPFKRCIVIGDFNKSMRDIDEVFNGGGLTSPKFEIATHTKGISATSSYHRYVNKNGRIYEKTDKVAHRKVDNVVYRGLVLKDYQLIKPDFGSTKVPAIYREVSRPSNTADKYLDQFDESRQKAFKSVSRNGKKRNVRNPKSFVHFEYNTEWVSDHFGQSASFETAVANGVPQRAFYAPQRRPDIMGGAINILQPRGFVLCGFACLCIIFMLVLLTSIIECSSKKLKFHTNYKLVHHDRLKNGVSGNCEGMS